MMRLFATCVLLTACSTNDFMDFEVDVAYMGEADGTAKLSGTIFDTPFAGDASMYHYDDGEFGELMVSTQYVDGTQGMLVGFVNGRSLSDLFESSGSYKFDDGLFVSLCGDNDEGHYDEPADDVVIQVTEDEDGNRDVLFRGSADDGRRFQEARFTLASDGFVPVIPD